MSIFGEYVEMKKAIQAIMLPAMVTALQPNLLANALVIGPKMKEMQYTFFKLSIPQT